MRDNLEAASEAVHEENFQLPSPPPIQRWAMQYRESIPIPTLERSITLMPIEECIEAFMRKRQRKMALKAGIVRKASNA